MVSTLGGVINAGDNIAVSSTTPGIGVRASRAGYIIGHAIEAFDPAHGLGMCVTGTATSTDATSTCVGLITIQLAQGWSEGDRGLLASLADDIRAFTASSTSTTTATMAAGEFMNSIFTAITNWFASATNGIADLYAKIIHADTVETKTLCLDNLCVTRDQLQQMLAGTGAIAVAMPSSTTPVTPVAPPAPVPAIGSGGVVTPVDTSSTTTSTTPLDTTVPEVPPIDTTVPPPAPVEIGRAHV